MSWILEVKRRLAEPPPQIGDTGCGSAAIEHWASVVAVSVEGGELWVALVDAPEDDPWGCRLTLPGAAVAPGDNPWQVVAEVAREELGMGSEQVLALGRLDALTLPGGLVVVPHVVALPSREAAETAAGLVRVPLQAISHPRLVEERSFRIGDRLLAGRVLHVGRHRLQGPLVQILEQLLERLGVQAAS